MKAILTAIVFFLLPISFTFAADFSITPSGELYLSLQNISNSSPVPGGSSLTLYRNTYPASTTIIASLTNGGSIPTDFLTYMSQMWAGTPLIIGNTLKVDIEATISPQIDGEYWLRAVKNPDIDEWYQFKRENGEWLPNVQTISNNSSIVSAYNLVGTTSTSTTQSFQINYVSGQPAPTDVCLQFERQIEFMNSALIERCAPVTQSGTLSYATTTQLTEGFYTWYATLKVGTTTISRSTLKTIQIGNSQYQTIITDYNSTTSVPSIDTYCNTLSSNSQGAWLVPACKMLLEIYGFSGLVLTNIFTFAYGQLLQTAPLSWALVVNNVWSQAQLTSTQSTGLNLEMPFNTNVSILEKNQVINQLGQTSIDVIHNLTTVFFGVMLWLYFRRVVFDRLV